MSPFTKILESFTGKSEIFSLRNKRVFVSLIVFLISWFVLFLLVNNFTFAFSLSILLGAVNFFVLKKLPDLKRRFEDEKREKEIPFFLEKIAIGFELGLSFEKSLGEYSKERGFFAREIRNALKNIYLGRNLEAEFLKIAKRTGNEDVKRGLLHVLGVYEYGNDPESLKTLANEILENQKLRAKEFNSKVGMLSLIFIASAAVLPALFQSFLVVGSMILDTGLEKIHAILIPGIVFPLVNCFILALIWFKTPGFLK